MRSGSKSILETHPKLSGEWDYVKNIVKIAEVSKGMDTLVWWECKRCKHSWKSAIKQRVRGSRCPKCAWRKVNGVNNLEKTRPELVLEWDWGKNRDKKPNQYIDGSAERIWWRCGICEHSWRTAIQHRVGVNSGCPACAGLAPNKYNNVKILFPDIVKEWDYILNYPKLPSGASPTSRYRAWWCCSCCGYKYRKKILLQVFYGLKKGCIRCRGLKYKYPNLYEEVLNKDGVNKYISYGSNKKIVWKCSKCGGIWEATITHRALSGSGCPLCANCSSISKISQGWLDSLGITAREYYIKDLGFRVDGFDPKTNTVYEFLGDYWHGNPKTRKINEINETISKTFGQLYQEWLDRKKRLEKSGYSVVYIWESDFKEQL